MSLSWWSRRPVRRQGRWDAAAVEPLERRSLLSAGPAVTGIELFGPAGAIDSVVLSFNESLNAATAQNVKAYSFGKPPPQSNNGFNLGDLLPFAGKPKAAAVIAGKVQFQSAVYDDSAHTVTLTPKAPFSAIKVFRILRVRGAGANAIKDVAGNPLDGGIDAVWKWVKRQGKQISYTDSDGDHVSITLHGPGTLYAFVRRFGGGDPALFVASTKPNSVITGIVHRARTGNGSAAIGEIQGLEGVHNNLLNNPSFIIAALTP